jgi:hypothetical protein
VHLDGRGRVAFDLARALREPLEQLEPEELREDPAALGRVAHEELREPSLREQDGARERLVRQPDRVRDHDVRLAHPVGALAGLGPVRAVEPLEQDLRRAGLRGRRTRDAIAPPVDRELQHHRHPRLPLADELRGLTADALDLAEERVRHGVEDRRLARPRRSGNREEVESVLLEVDRLLVAEGGEALDLHPDRSHASAPSVSASCTSSNASSSASTGSAWWCAR